MLKRIDKEKPTKIAKAETVTITPPNFQMAAFLIRGTSPLVQHAFSEKARHKMEDTHRQGSVAKKGKKKDPRKFDEEYEAARHRSAEGWDGIPSAAFRDAAISACRTVGFAMTRAKLSIFCVADGYSVSGTALTKILKGSPHPDTRPVRNDSGVTDLRCRPMWDPGWECRVVMRWDADQFSATDVANLMARVGMQVGIGEGRADSKNSSGQGWGHFEVIG